MTQNEFAFQVDRLKNTYGEKPYPEERVKLLWREVSQFHPGWFERVVDDAIATQQYPPMVQYFAEKAATERERVYKIEKEQHEDEAKEFMSSFSGPDIQSISAQIRDRIKGTMGDADFGSMVKMLENVTKGAHTCKCEGTGLVLIRQGGGDTVYRCTCKQGQKRRERYAFYKG